jgi:hypothetical protein
MGIQLRCCGDSRDDLSEDLERGTRSQALHRVIKKLVF